eukprot:TRINITY_DN24707_c0_g1_i1.p4 TRINITY_DN24707_c0_g1~~TRINITY_DN24707_c0_g1_i1.p4  ORF type:complete len:115 (-),score=18.50 TRINITY_DN24707_c0_g1_i1:186-530(-)
MQRSKIKKHEGKTNKEESKRDQQRDRILGKPIKEVNKRQEKKIGKEINNGGKQQKKQKEQQGIRSNESGKIQVGKEQAQEPSRIMSNNTKEGQVRVEKVLSSIESKQVENQKIW